MKVGWLIDAEMFGEYLDEFVTCIRGQGHEARLIHGPQPPYRWDDADCSYRKAFPPGTCVIAHGDIELVNRIRTDRRWIPSVFATFEHFSYSYYSCRIGEFLLNRHYVMLPFGELRRCREFLMDAVGRDGRIFVRPDSPLKLFTGQVVANETFEADLEFMAFYEFPPESLVVVSAPHIIEAEWRFVAVNGRVVAGSLYKRAGQMCVQAGYDQSAFDLAVRIASAGWQPDPAWVIDICRTGYGAYHMLEIGGFSFANLYACDKTAVVEAVSEAAAGEWESAQR